MGSSDLQTVTKQLLFLGERVERWQQGGHQIKVEVLSDRKLRVDELLLLLFLSGVTLRVVVCI